MFKRFALPFVAALSAATALPVAAQSYPLSHVIAHRGLFHSYYDANNVPENTEGAVAQAADFGLGGVELDLRLSSDGVPMVYHDLSSNRGTLVDGDNGYYNAANGYRGISKSSPAIAINSHTAAYWTNQDLKYYTKNGEMTWTQTHVDTLTDMLNFLKSYSGIWSNRQFKIIFDIQDPNVLLQTAIRVQSQSAALKQHIYLKFFASKALFYRMDGRTFQYNGSEVCYAYAAYSHLQGLNIIPQINDGELTPPESEDDSATINAFGAQLYASQYLQCWADAQSQHNDAAKMSIVSASVPYGKPWATTTAQAALDWARSHGRQTMTIVPNPDTGYNGSNGCNYLTFSSTPPYAIPFNFQARAAKNAFFEKNNTDYVITDVMNYEPKGWMVWDTNTYNSLICK